MRLEALYKRRMGRADDAMRERPVIRLRGRDNVLNVGLGTYESFFVACLYRTQADIEPAREALVAAILPRSSLFNGTRNT